VTTQWHLSTTKTSWVTGAALLGAVIGAFVFGRIADVLGRKSVYVLVAAIMIVGALASAFSPSFVWLVMSRFVLGLGIGGDYPVSAVLMSEYSNRRDRGRLVGMVFSMQALGLIVGPLVGLALLSSGIGQALSWRLLLGLGAVPAAGVVYLRSRCLNRRDSKRACKGRVNAPPVKRPCSPKVFLDTSEVSPKTPSENTAASRAARLPSPCTRAWNLGDSGTLSGGTRLRPPEPRRDRAAASS